MENKRIFNFSAGPSELPLAVLEKAAEQMTNYEGSGMGVMEMSHRSKVYDGIIKDTEARLRRVMNIPDNYKVLFLQGGATLQFSMVPMNLMTKSGKADYVVTGSFASKAQKEAAKYGDVGVAFSGKSEGFVRIPRQDELTLRADADYVHICENNTIVGTKWNYVPDTAGVPLVSDMSSCILSEPVDVSRYGVIYAGAQKNMGPAGLAVVIIREDLLGEAQKATPVLMEYKTNAENDSMYNTPNTWAIYVLGLVLEWVEANGGTQGMQELAQRRSGLLYDFIDGSNGYYKNPNDKASRSKMNVVFRLPNEELEAKFVKESVAQGMSNLKGHRSVGGIRASIYNAMPVEGVEHLVAFMKRFMEENPI
ncbi:Phosphoserine aminotransferase [Clostridiaceae bacterium JG1575]|nr:Phosphoserine aminotransferase [Clostridiaceae bacterium JG1575]